MKIFTERTAHAEYKEYFKELFSVYVLTWVFSKNSSPIIIKNRYISTIFANWFKPNAISILNQIITA
jgi:hypothetical protein